MLHHLITVLPKFICLNCEKSDKLPLKNFHSIIIIQFLTKNVNVFFSYFYNLLKNKAIFLFFAEAMANLSTKLHNQNTFLRIFL